MATENPFMGPVKGLIIRVICESREDGGLYLYSDELPGLHVSDPDPEKAINYTGIVIEKLLKLNFGLSVTARPAFDFETMRDCGKFEKSLQSVCPAGFIIDATTKDVRESPH